MVCRVFLGGYHFVETAQYLIYSAPPYFTSSEESPYIVVSQLEDPANHDSAIEKVIIEYVVIKRNRDDNFRCH